jgi:hypothetical protein
MSGKPSRLAVIAALSIMTAAPALTAEGVHIDELVVATSIPESQRDATVKAFSRFGGVKRAPRGNSMGQTGQRVRHG